MLSREVGAGSPCESAPNRERYGGGPIHPIWPFISTFRPIPRARSFWPEAQLHQQSLLARSGSHHRQVPASC
jgi:hypothetical protein